MVKLVVLCSKLIAAAIAALLFTSCHASINWSDGIDGNGKVTTQNRTVPNDFTKIEASRGLNVTLEQASTYSVTVEADDNLQEHITVQVTNGKLYITSDENIDEATAKNVHVKLPSLTGIESNSGASIKTNTLFTGTTMALSASSGSHISANLEIDTIQCESSSGSSLDIQGKALQLTTASSSGSSIAAEKMFANEITAGASSGSTIHLHPIVKLTATASSGSAINYNIEPKFLSKNESSGGSISKE
jgi:hypothetical protein